VREAFVAMAAASPEHYLVVDARAPIAEIHTAIMARLRPLLTQAVR
jgi:dTMP kinase